MPAINPQTFFRFAADHHQLLTELYYRQDGLAEAELLELIRRHAPSPTPGATYMRERLVALGVLESAPHAAAQYEMVRPVARLLAYLLREHRLTSVAVIQSYFTALDRMATELSAAVTQANADLVVRIGREIDDHMERMRHDSRENRASVVAMVVATKANVERLPPQRRYAVINRLWTNYIVPLRDIIDTEKAMDAALDRLERIQASARDQFHADGTMVYVLRVAEARLRRMRQDVLQDFHESMREVTPLYEELRQETAVARGAARALELAAQQGGGALRLPVRLGICNWQVRGLFSDLALAAYAHVLHGYQPVAPPALPEPEATGAGAYLAPGAFAARVAAALPLQDALEWLTATFPDASLTGLLRLYARLHGGSYGPIRFGADPRVYRHGHHLLRAHPMAVDAAVPARPGPPGPGRAASP